ncbi:MAG TPA: hypothetical protein VMF13_00570 [Luteitalea sp.]|nr:hypothetical protein [Luteitalea sp.]
MVPSLGIRLRALWLVLLLALAPGPGALFLAGHASDGAAHATAAPVHDPSDHGISAGALGEVTSDRHCLYCQTASSVRFGGLQADARLSTPLAVVVDWPNAPAAALHSRLRQALPARAPPPTL